jgi:hypothetical protein
MPDDEPWGAYASTILWIGHAPRIKVDLREPIAHDLRRLLTNLGLGATFAVVTPFDPHGARVSAEENEARYLRTQLLLASRNLLFVPADGESPDAAHRERGFAIAMERSDAAVLARELEQLALYWFDGEAFWIDGALAARAPQRLP